MALLLEQFDEEVAPEGLAEMGSFNHGYLQLKIGSYFVHQPNFTPSSELSLDISMLSKTDFEATFQAKLPKTLKTLKPDIAVYNQWSVDFHNDILEAQKMPVLAIEILSPMQGVQTLVDKFKVYFALGVHSCWLVYPYAKAIAVYHAPDQFNLFAQGNLIDDVADVTLSLEEIFN